MEPEPLMEQIKEGLWRYGPVFIRRGEPHAKITCEVVRLNPSADRMQLADLINAELRKRTGAGLEHDDVLVRRWVGPAFPRVNSLIPKER